MCTDASKGFWMSATACFVFFVYFRWNKMITGYIYAHNKYTLQKICTIIILQQLAFLVKKKKKMKVKS